MKFSTVLFNNSFFHETEVTYPFEERGLHFGDGIYEVMRLYNGNFFLLSEHLERLYRSAEEIKLNIKIDILEWERSLKELVTRNQCEEDAIVYLQITRGSFPREHSFPKEEKPNMLAYLKPMSRPTDKLANGVSVTLLEDIRWLRCDIKSLNLLPNVLAKQEAVSNGFFEAILHRSETITEGSASNFFIVKDNTIYTHPATNLILNGITRVKLFEICKKLDITIQEKAFTMSEVFEADECFLTSTTAEVMPICQVDAIKIINSKSKSIVRELQNGFQNEIDKHNE